MKKNIILYIVALITLYGCDDVLNKTDMNGQNSGTFMKYASQVGDAVTAVYDPLSYGGLYSWSFIVLGEAPTDNIYNPWGDGGFGPDLVSIHYFRWKNTNQYFGSRWNACYKGIVRANYVLDNIDNAGDLSPDMKDRYIGEVLFLRSLFYFNLVSGFGDVPFPTTVLAPEKANTIKKTASNEIWSQLDKDLLNAALKLPVSYGKSEVGRVTKGAAYGLLSRIRLWTKDYKGAAEAATEVEKLGYSLVDSNDFVHMFDGMKQNSNESIFEVQFVGGKGKYWSAESAETTILQHIWPRISWGQYLRPRKVNDENGNKVYDILDIFEKDDIRRQGSILIAGVDKINYPEFNKTSVFPDFDLYKDFRADLKEKGALQMRKFLYHDPAYWRAGGKYFSVGSAINVPVIRYAEVILNRAEALAMIPGKTAEAWTELKKIRDRAGLTMDGISDSDADALLVQIKKDRRVELLFEGHRWGDLKRWGELNDLVDAGLNYNSSYEYWPIPSNEVNINPNLK
ncbi:RagB/SusD family nutrient uptake outer membrane protein [Halosquirtibacter xylanolyticus]|uniref:RagB/SusD family nutrient uptake outer membrane protein n=1 Tax=Halosquirtibacter xylanolyticus TaxID=3374599 RepID=UPI00374A31C7|nr:RagB/SusD family nutrient uptake outer membrane protein [Prolixibacteraceae bacterium]